jgi:pimeloyl-ACP methyl ester carboxylesterase
VKTIKGTLEIGRFEIPYRQYGESEHLLMCVSGALQTMAIWRTVVRRFSDRFTVVVFDMPGIGRSRIKSGGAHVTVEEQLETLHLLIERTHPGGEVTLAGSSWGTAIAAAYAALNPDAVQHLILSSFGMKPNSGMKELVRRAVAVYEAGDYGRGADLILEMFGDAIGESYKRQIISQFEQLNDAHAEAFFEHTSNILKLGSLDDVIDLTKIKARTLIVNGARDTIVDLQDMYVAQRLIPNCRIQLVPDVGHFLHFERPELLDDYEDFMLAREPTALAQRL